MRKPLGVALALVATALLLALGIADAQKGPITVGLILPETGPLATNANDMANGMQLFFEEQGWRIAGREVELITEDDEGKPTTGLAKTRSLVRFDDYGKPVQNIYVRTVERVGGKLQNAVIFTFPSVSKFWTCKPEDCQKNPVYSRDYPPCTKC